MTEMQQTGLSTDIKNNSITLEKFILYNKAPYVIPLYAIGYSLQFLLCILGNALELYILPKIKQPEDYITYAICALACSDLIQGFITMPINFIEAIFYDWFLGEFTCRFVCMFLFYVNANIGIWITVYIGFDRYINFCHPFRFSYLKDRNFCLTILSCICIGNSVIFAYIYLFSIIKIDYDKLCQICILELSEIHLAVHRIIVYLIYMYALPVSLMIYFYFSVLHNLSKLMTVNSSSNKGYQETDNRKLPSNIFIKKVLLCLVVIFIIANFPLFLHKIFDMAYNRKDDEYLSSGFKELESIGYFMQTMTSCLNPWIYSIYSKKFRKEFIKIFQRNGQDLLPKSSYFILSAKKMTSLQMDDENFN